MIIPIDTGEAFDKNPIPFHDNTQQNRYRKGCLQLERKNLTAYVTMMND